MPIEKEPLNKVPPTYVPPASIPYKVKDRETWVTIARAHGLEPWELIAANFKTRDAPEVNWYLHRRVGCKVPTDDGLNWKFSASADPGRIYIPRGPLPNVKIDVVDMYDPGLGTHRRNLVLGSGSVLIELYGMSNGIGQMVTEIMRVAVTSMIVVLRIWGHGWAGGQLIASGKEAQMGVDHGSALWNENLARFEPELRRLRHYFRKGSHVELKGCRVASGAKGERLLISLARALQVDVIAATDVQGGKEVWRAGRHWDGPLVQASPNGALASVNWTPL